MGGHHRALFVSRLRNERIAGPRDQPANTAADAPALVSAVAFSRNGRRIASASYIGDTTVSLWDAETGKELHRFAGHASDVYDVAFSTDGRFLVSGGLDKSVRVWRLPR